VKLDERILRDFKIGVFVGLKKSNQGMHTAFFINGKETRVSDISVLLGGLKAIPAQVRKAYLEAVRSSPKNAAGPKIKKKTGKKKDS
jgi:hypothetical protein